MSGTGYSTNIKINRNIPDKSICCKATVMLRIVEPKGYFCSTCLKAIEDKKNG